MKRELSNKEIQNKLYWFIFEVEFYYDVIKL